MSNPVDNDEVNNIAVTIESPSSPPLPTVEEVAEAAIRTTFTTASETDTTITSTTSCLQLTSSVDNVDNVTSTSESDLSSTINFDNLCSICLNEVSVTSYADGCLHKFCGRCIFEWGRRSQLCPICRTFFANIITNVLSDTEYEVIPMEERRISAFSDSWWTTNNARNHPPNRNIFAVRQFPQRHQNQFHQYHPQQQQQHPINIPHQQPSLSSEQPPSMIEPSSVSMSGLQQQQLEGVDNNQHQPFNQQLNVEFNPVIRGMDNLYIGSRRPRRVIWSSHHRQSFRQSNSNNNNNNNNNIQFQRPQPHTSSSAPSSSQQFIHPSRSSTINPSFRPHNYVRGHRAPVVYFHPVPNIPDPNQHQNVHIPHQAYTPRPMRPLIGVRQENFDQHQQQSQFNSNNNSSNYQENRQRFCPIQHQHHQHQYHQHHHHQHHHQQQHHQQQHHQQQQYQHQNQHHQQQHQNQQHSQPQRSNPCPHRGVSPTFKRLSRSNDRARRR